MGKGASEESKAKDEEGEPERQAVPSREVLFRVQVSVCVLVRVHA